MQQEEMIKVLISMAQQGDDQSRQDIIQDNKIFVQQLTSKICKRPVSWNDDEMSISLIAFNEAINRYAESQNDNFYNFAKVVIHSRLIDYFRKQGRQQMAVSLDAVTLDADGEEYQTNPAEIKHSWQQYHEQQLVRERMEEIEIYSERLEEFGIYFEELEDASPDRIDARKNLIQLAYQFVEYPHLVDLLEQTKQLPIKQILQFARVSRKTMERGRKYLLALIVILVADDLPHLKSSIIFPDLGRSAEL
jgi:RNA polymerase sigma factor